MEGLPYPPVFHDWRPDVDRRVTTRQTAGGVGLETRNEFDPPGNWREMELTEDDACLLAASLLERAGHKKLARRVIRKVTEKPAS